MSDTKKLHQCPCCDYLSLSKRGGHEICKICFWHDDGQDIDKLDHVSGPNYITLREGRANFKKYGAKREDRLRYVLKPEERSQYKYEPRDIS